MARSGRNNKAQRVQILETDYGSTGGSYSMAMKSGLLTLIAAKTDTAGHMAAFRNGSATLEVIVDRIRAKWVTTTGFTSAQVIGMQLFMARSYTAAHTGGTAATITTNNGKKRTAHPTLADIDMRIGDTAALTAGTHTLDAQPFRSDGTQELADGAGVIKKSFELLFEPAPGTGGILLAQNEGFVLTNTVLGGAAGVWNVHLEVDFHVVDVNSTFVQ